VTVTVSPAITLIVAVAENGVIGAAGAMPWRLKSDLQHFKRLTLGRPVLMGRKTYQSIGRPLPGRTNIVVTRDRDFAAPGVAVANSFAAAEAIALGDALRRNATAIAVIGGTEIFAHWIDTAECIELTEVHARPEGDTYFPAIDPECWIEVARSHNVASADDSADFSYVTYRRRTPR